MVRTAFKIAIVARGFSQRQLARLSDITENRISEIANGWKEPTVDEQHKLSTILEQPVDSLFGNDVRVELRSIR